jgi:uncharacterized protein
MATYGRPGVYISETLLPAPITQTSTANAAAAVVGVFSKGPTTVTRVTSWYDFVNLFGGYSVAFPATFSVSLFFQNGGSELYVKRIVRTQDSTSGNNAQTATVTVPTSDTAVNGFCTITAKNIGADGNNIRVQISGTSVTNYYDITVYREAGVADTIAGGVVTANGGDDLLVERFTNVRFDLSTSSDYAPTVVANNSVNISLTISTAQASNITAGKTPSLSLIPLSGGSDGSTAIVAADFTTGNFADFDSVLRPLVVFAPELSATLGSDTNARTVYNALIDWADNNQALGFVIVDAPSAYNADGTTNFTVDTALTWGKSLSPDNGYAAVYHPYLYIADPLGRSNGALRKVVPSGAIAGLYLATDKVKGPFKSPAGTAARLAGVVGVERQFTAAELDSLNTGIHTVSGSTEYAYPINPIRNLPGAGIVPMGARTILNDGTANKYVAMRRSLIYIKKRLEDITQFAMFESNDELLWARIRTAVGIFLNEYRNQGGLRGTTAAQAYFVKCDSQNNTASSIANGEVRIQVGVALQYPAEFVVINLSQTTGN